MTSPLPKVSAPAFKKKTSSLPKIVPFATGAMGTATSNAVLVGGRRHSVP